MRHTPTFAWALFLLPWPTLAHAQGAESTAAPTPAEASPAFTSVPELTAGFNQLYEHKFPEARATFLDWQSHHSQEPFAEVAIAASYLFEELYRQGVLTSDFF